jgi:hypothetical protein
MFSFKRFSILIVAFLFAVSLAMGQSRSGDDMSIEESYLQRSIEMMIIRETSRTNSMDQKMVALEYIGQAIKGGNTDDEIRQTLEYLALEGLTIESRENGRLINNFPLVRRQAAKYLGEVGTVEAKNSLLKICLAENEPMVLQEVVKSLGDIGLNDNDETLSTITWIVKRFDVLNPDNLLALSTIDAFEKIAKKNSGFKNADAIRLLMSFAEGGYYIKPVQDRARQFISYLRTMK